MVATQSDKLNFVAGALTRGRFDKYMSVIQSANGMCGTWHLRRFIINDDAGDVHYPCSPYLYHYKDAPDSMFQWWVAYVRDNEFHLAGYADLDGLINTTDASGEQNHPIIFMNISNKVLIPGESKW